MLLATLLVGLAAPSGASAASLISGFSAGALVDTNTSSPASSDYDAQAGSHPDVLFANIGFDTSNFDSAKDIRVDLPAGLSVNPQAIPQCNSSATDVTSCPSDTEVGTDAATITNIPLFGSWSGTVDVYNMTPAAGTPGDFAFTLSIYGIITVRVDLVAGVRYYPSNGQPGDFGEYVTISNIANTLGAKLQSTDLTLWGAPEEHNGGGATDNALITNPTTCGPAQTTYMNADTYTGGQTGTASSTPPVGIGGCGSVPFSPSFTTTPSTTKRDSPDGLDTDVHVPQDETPSHTASSDVSDVSITLPPGVTINPSGASGRQACTDAEFGAGTNNAVTCPASSAVGTVEIDSPAVSTALTGDVYLGSPQTGNPYRFFVDGEDSTDGLIVRLTGSISADPSTGQLTATINGAPQLPFSDFKLDFSSGTGALLANPLSCGSATTTTSLTPWSGNAAATPSASFTVDNNGSGGACPGTLPFAPVTTVTPGNLNAGAADTLTLSTARADGDQTLAAVNAKLPPGMLADVAAIPLCSDANANAGTCAASSQIGTATIAAGAGTAPLALTGQVYLTAAYNGQPFGLSIVVPAVAGPYNLGTVVVRAAVGIDTVNGQVTIATDPMPTILQGVPLRVRTVSVDINAAGFLHNPTTCTGGAATGSITSTLAAIQTFSSTLTMTGCGSLSFNPTISVTPTTTKRDTPTGLALDLHIPSGNSDLQDASVTLPSGMSINPSVANALGSSACTDTAFATNSCPASSQVGTAEIDSPLLSTAFTGNVYVGSQTSNTYELFVDAYDATDNLDVHLTGTVTANTSTGQLTTTFTNTPPIPFTDLKLTFTGGQDALLANGQSCGTATTTTVLTPYSGGANATPSTSFTVDNNGSGGACPGTLPFAPAVTSTYGNTTAGAYNTLTLATVRSDGDQTLSTIAAQLPPGLLANLSSIPRCDNTDANAGTCATSTPASQIGTTAVTAGAGTDPLSLSGGKVYLTSAYGGKPFGLSIVVPAIAGPYNLGTVVVRAAVDVNTATGQVTMTTDALPTILDGVPLRLRTVSVDINAASFLINPTSCAATATTGTITSTGAATSNFNNAVTMSGCGSIAFAPTLSVTPSTTQRDTPTGVDVNLAIPSGDSDLQSATVTLPAGMSINPSAANGLSACSDAQFGAGTENPVTCPTASAVGTVKIDTPLLAGELTGNVYVGTQQTGNPYRIFLDAEDPADGLSVRLVGNISADATSGQLTTSFSSPPPIPFTALKLHFNGGSGALLANSLGCGTATTTSVLVPTTGGANGTPSDQFTVDNDGSGGACPGALPFAPSANATLGNTNAGAANSVTLSATRSDGNQILSGVHLQLPPGMVANIASVPQCSNANANAGTCAAASEIGTTTVTAGAGTNPYSLTGQVYLTTAYNGQPFGLSIVVPAIAGPFNLGTAVVRASIAINIPNGQVTIDSDPLPTILDGVPLRLRNVTVAINAANFITNPTTCAAATVTGAISDVNADLQTFSDPATMTGCGSVAFSPTITVTPGTTKRDSPTSLALDVHVPSGNSDLQAASVTLPAGMSINPSVANALGSSACTDALFAANNCPASSQVGTAEIDSPLVSTPFTGHVYVGAQTANSYELFLDAYDATDNLDVHLTGTVTANTSTGQLTTAFTSAPPIPFTDLKLSFGGGADALLANGQSCGTATTTSVLTPNSGGANATPSTSYTVDNNGSGGACPGTLPFAPTVTTTPGNTTAGANDTLTLTTARADGDQTLKTIAAQLPPGMLANLSTIPRCDNADANAGTCAASTPASQIGTTAITAGAGTDPYSLSGNVYFTTAYNGAPFGLSIVVHALAGPYDLGTVVVRGAVDVDTATGQVKITTDPLPTILDGVPLRLRTVSVDINAANFLINPTSCAVGAATGTITSTGAASSNFNDAVTMSGCGSIAFAPTLSVTPSTTQRDTPTGLDVNLHIPSGDSDLQSAAVTLPAGMSINPSAANGLSACSDAQFGAGTENPVTCPAASAVGTVEIDTPLLAGPLTGNVYVGTQQTGNPYRVFLDAEDPADGLSVRLVGNISADATTGQLTTNFTNPPPIPFTAPEAALQQRRGCAAGQRPGLRHGHDDPSVLVPTTGGANGHAVGSVHGG